MSLLSPLSRILRSFPPSRNKARLGRIVTKMLIHGRMNSVAEVRLLDGSRMLLDARSRTESGAFWNGEHDRDDIDFFKVCMTMGNAVFDVGANVGLIAIPLARFLRDNGGGTLMAFEPVKANFDRLVDAIHLNELDQIATAFDVALGDEEGEIEMALETRNKWQKGSLTGNAVIRKGMKEASQYSISRARIARLDAFARGNGIDRVDFIKVDIEGAELMFLRGGVDFLSRHRPIIYGEFNFPMMPQYNHTFLDVVDLIKPWRYRIFAFGGRLLPVEVLQPTIGIGNIFLVPEEKAVELLRRVEVARQKTAVK